MRLIHAASILLLKTKAYLLNYCFVVSFIFNDILHLFCTLHHSRFILETLYMKIVGVADSSHSHCLVSLFPAMQTE